jgi:hypothetical protein
MLLEVFMAKHDKKPATELKTEGLPVETLMPAMSAEAKEHIRLHDEWEKKDHDLAKCLQSKWAKRVAEEHKYN